VIVLDVQSVEKRFRIPSVRRATLREHLFGLFRPRSFETLDVLRGVSFNVQRGETLGIMGRNGSGKSTLLKILAGIYQPDAGRVAVHAPLTPILNLGLGWNPELTARDNLELTGTAMGFSLREIRSHFDEILAFAELERFVDMPVKFYSDGMNARLAYAIAFRAVREVLLLDEVFAVGDAAFTRRCQDRYVELHKAGHTMVLVSHDPVYISTFCQRAILLEGGRIHMEGDSKAVANEYLRLVGPDAGPDAGRNAA
jgi:ABC-type polysaccharide/polyol phosphate transport system ATPase subunit